MADVKALALYTNEAEDSDELSFRVNDLLIVIEENWQDGWHLCRLGDKQGVAPANYLQILVKPVPVIQDPVDNIYDSPRNLFDDREGRQENDSSDYMNTGIIEEDIYMNTSAFSLNDSRVTLSPVNHRSVSPQQHPNSDKRVPPPIATSQNRPPLQPRKILYPEQISPQAKHLHHQNSEYVDMRGPGGSTGEYIDIEGVQEEAEDDINDYDEVPNFGITNSHDGYDSGAINNSSNESMKSSSLHLYGGRRSSESIQSSKVSNESIKSYDSGISSSKQESTRDSPPTLPEKEHHRTFENLSNRSPSNNFASNRSPSNHQSSPQLSSHHTSSESSVHQSCSSQSLELEDYMIPPSHHQLSDKMTKRHSDHDYFDPPTPPVKTAVTKTNSQPSKVVDIGERQQGKQQWKLGVSSDKKKKKSSAGLDQIPKLFSNLTLKKGGKHANNNNTAGGHTNLDKKLSKSLEQIAKHTVHHTSLRPLPSVPNEVDSRVCKTEGESSMGQKTWVEYRERPLPPTPHSEQYQQQDYVDIEEDEEQAEYVDVESVLSAPRIPRAPSVQSALAARGARHSARAAFERQRSRSLGMGEKRRYSNHRRSVEVVTYEGCQYVTSDVTHEDDEDYHDYTELPEFGNHGNSGGNHGNSGGNHGNSGGNHGNSDGNQHLPANINSVQNLATEKNSPVQGPSPSHQPNSGPLPNPHAVSGPVPTAHVTSSSEVKHVIASVTPVQKVVGINTPTPPPTVYSPATLAKLPVSSYQQAEPVPPPFKQQAPGSVQVVEIEMTDLSETDMILIKEHCGVISSSLLRAATESLIKLKYVTDNKDVENYVTACTATGSACIEMIKHLTVMADRCHNSALRSIATAHKTRLRDIVKRLVETVKIAKVQFPSAIAHNDMVTRRNELITAIREVKVFVVKLLHPTR